ncbi:MAG: hypothetical protein E7105_09785 [Prevotella sp.]|nr:hypothetical protein [Prevotella sp.]
MKLNNTHKSAPRGTKLEDAVRLGSDFTLSREHYHTDVRHSLSRRAKAFLKLMEGQLPEDVMEYVKRELASEARRDQNMIAQQLFNILIDSNQCCEPEDERLRLKLDELAGVVCCEADLREPVDWDADWDADWDSDWM